MAKGLIWATAEDLASNRGRVLSLYRQILRSLNSPDLPLNMAARLAKKAEARTIFIIASEERSVHNIRDLIDTAEYALSVLKKAKSPDLFFNEFRLLCTLSFDVVSSLAMLCYAFCKTSNLRLR